MDKKIKMLTAEQVIDILEHTHYFATHSYFYKLASEVMEKEYKEGCSELAFSIDALLSEAFGIEQEKKWS